jgi:hypothetical protein
MPYLPYVVGVVFTVALIILYKMTTRDSFSKLYEGADGRPSTSKFQFFLWTAVVLFSYTALYSVKLLQHPPNFDPIASLPDNLLIALGMSVISASAAKAITVSYVNTNRISKSSETSGGHFGDIFQDDSGVPDLSKVQMIAWTFIAIATYLIAVGHNIATQKPELPNIDKSLMALMGLGQAGYLAKKAVSSDTPDTVPVPSPAPPVTAVKPGNSTSTAGG